MSVYQYELKNTRTQYPFITAESDTEAVEQARKYAKEYNDRLARLWKEEEGKFVLVATFLEGLK